MYNFDDFAAYHGTALAMRDRLLVAWNETHQAYATKDPKRVYCTCLLWINVNCRFVVGVSYGKDFG
jgi:hypothetical protein